MWYRNESSKAVLQAEAGIMLSFAAVVSESSDIQIIVFLCGKLTTYQCNNSATASCHILGPDGVFVDL